LVGADGEPGLAGVLGLEVLKGFKVHIASLLKAQAFGKKRYETHQHSTSQ